MRTRVASYLVLNAVVSENTPFTFVCAFNLISLHIFISFIDKDKFAVFRLSN